jgi:hypothetical protein
MDKDKKGPGRPDVIIAIIVLLFLLAMVVSRTQV